MSYFLRILNNTLSEGYWEDVDEKAINAWVQEHPGVFISNFNVNEWDRLEPRIPPVMRKLLKVGRGTRRNDYDIWDVIAIGRGLLTNDTLKIIYRTLLTDFTHEEIALTSTGEYSIPDIEEYLEHSLALLFGADKEIWQAYIGYYGEYDAATRVGEAVIPDPILVKMVGIMPNFNWVRVMNAADEIGIASYKPKEVVDAAKRQGWRPAHE